MGDQKYLPLIFPSLVTCLLTKTRGVQDFFEEDKEKKWINIPVPPTFYDSFRVSKVGNFTTGVGKVTNFIFTQPGERGEIGEEVERVVCGFLSPSSYSLNINGHEKMTDLTILHPWKP